MIVWSILLAKSSTISANIQVASIRITARRRSNRPRVLQFVGGTWCWIFFLFLAGFLMRVSDGCLAEDISGSYKDYYLDKKSIDDHYRLVPWS